MLESLQLEPPTCLNIKDQSVPSGHLRSIKKHPLNGTVKGQNPVGATEALRTPDRLVIKI
jgi:hypothetical protein